MSIDINDVHAPLLNYICLCAVILSKIQALLKKTLPIKAWEPRLANLLLVCSNIWKEKYNTDTILKCISVQLLHSSFSL